ncbi:MAG: amino acid ABC transporter ATP-binding protein [Desulfuromusa sp.]|nr:amino acid ABC transporter ATP-binding protein [Desulfuromusa sp.]
MILPETISKEPLGDCRTIPDPEMIKEVLDVMIELADTGMTMVVVTHEMGFVQIIGHQVIFMGEGDIVEENEPYEFFNNPQHERTKQFLSQIL